MLTNLGIDGGSSDESDTEPGSIKVIVRERVWRNAKIKSIMKLLDEFKPKHTGAGRLLLGNPGRPRERREGERYATQDNVLSGLPENYYDPLYIHSLSPVRKQWLNPKPVKDLPLPTRSPYN